MPIFELSIDLVKLNAGAKGAVTILQNVSAQADKTDKSLGKMGNSTKWLPNHLRLVQSGAKEVAKGIKDVLVQMVALYGAYQALGAITGTIKDGFNFSSSLESSEIAIASVITATSKISTEQGKVLEGAEKFNAAQEISADMMKEIQVLALQTTASFDGIIEGVSSIIAPAVKAGIALERIPKFAVTAAKAMSVLKIPIEQMRTEIDAILTGNINRSQDILATRLNLTGEIVRGWIELGTLEQELNKRMSAFDLANKVTAESWAGLKSNMRDAKLYLSGLSGKGMFEGAKQSYSELLALMVSTEGEIGVGKDIENIVSAVKELQDEIGIYLVEVTRDFIDYIKELNKPENLNNLKKDVKDILTGMGDVAETAGTIIGKIGEIGGAAFDAWQSLPEEIREFGLVAVIFGGKKGLVAVTAALVILDNVQTKIEGITQGFKGNLSLAEFGLADHAGKGKEFLEESKKAYAQSLLISSHGANAQKPTIFLDAPKVQLASAHQSVKGLEKPKKKKYTTESLFGNEDDTEANEKAAEAYVKSVQKRETALASLEAQTMKLLLKQEEWQKWELTNVTMPDLAKKALPPEMLKEFEDGKKSIAELAEQYGGAAVAINEFSKAKLKSFDVAADEKAKDDQNKNLDIKADFYKELGERTGDYTQTLKYQNIAINEQVEIWKKAGIPPEYIAQMEQLNRLDYSRNGWDGLTRAADQHYTDATNWATNFGDLYVSSIDGMTNALTDWVTTGKISFHEMTAEFARMLADMAIRAAASSVGSSLFGSVGGIGGILGGLFGGGASASVAPASGLMESVMGGVSFFHNGGMVGAGSPMQGIVPTSTFKDAERWHTGHNPLELASNEVPAILLKNERVLNPQETYAYNAGVDAGAMTNFGTSHTGMFDNTPSIMDLTNPDFAYGSYGMSDDRMYSASMSQIEALNRNTQAMIQENRANNGGGMGGGEIIINQSFTIEGGGGANGEQGSFNQEQMDNIGRTFRQSIKGIVQETILKEMRAGGMFRGGK